MKIPWNVARWFAARRAEGGVPRVEATAKESAEPRSEAGAEPRAEAGASAPGREEGELFGFVRHDPVESRRALLRKIAFGVPLTGALGGGVAWLIKHGSPPPKKPVGDAVPEEELPPLQIIDVPKEQKSGDIISTPAGPIEIRGWKVVMAGTTISQIEWLAPDSGVEYTLAFRSPKEGQTLRLYTSQVRHELDFPLDVVDLEGKFQPEKAFYLLPNIPDPVIGLEVRKYPAEKMSLEREVFTPADQLAKARQEHHRQATEMHRYRIRLAGRHESLRGSEKPGVFAEGPIPQSQLDRVADLRRLLAKLGDVAPVYIYGEGDEDLYWQQAPFSQHYDPYYHRVALTFREFIHPDVPHQGEQVAGHELLHSLRERSSLSGPQDAAHTQMEQAFGGLGKIVAQSPDVEPREHPVFAIFRELTHYGPAKVTQRRLQAGHPWDNSNELFASAGMVFRYYPQQFLRAFAKLPSEQRGPVAQAARSVIGFLRSMNGDPAVLRELIPQLADIEAAVTTKA